MSSAWCGKTVLHLWGSVVCGFGAVIGRSVQRPSPKCDGSPKKTVVIRKNCLAEKTVILASTSAQP